MNEPPKNLKVLPPGASVAVPTWLWDWSRYPTLGTLTGPRFGILVLDGDFCSRHLPKDDGFIADSRNPYRFAAAALIVDDCQKRDGSRQRAPGDPQDCPDIERYSGHRRPRQFRRGHDQAGQMQADCR